MGAVSCMATLTYKDKMNLLGFPSIKMVEEGENDNLLVSKYMNYYRKEWNSLQPCWMEKVMHLYFKTKKIQFRH